MVMAGLLILAALTAVLSPYAHAQAANGRDPGGMGVNELATLRQSYLDYWQVLESRDLGGLERFARTVQRVVDVRSTHGESDEDRRRLVLDDLVDIFVSGKFSLEKSMVMSTPSVVGDAALIEEDDDLEEFALPLRAGEGRFRHFALNAAAAESAPDALVELAARLRGKDLLGASPDSTADRETNRLGRAFNKLLRERPFSELADGETVRDWVMEKFGE